MKKAVLIGGHSTPALALLKELQKRGWKIYYFGSKYASLRDIRLLSYEYRVLQKEERVAFIPLPAQGWPRSVSWQSIRTIWAFQRSFWKAFLTLLRLRPNIVVGFGGYLTPPVVLAAAVLRIPVILHEQTTTLGLGNRIALPFAKKIALAFSDSHYHIPVPKRVLVGNLLREEVMQPQRTLANKQLLSLKGKKFIYLTGGKTGSLALNAFLARELKNILPEYGVVHQTGELEYQRFLRLRRHLPSEWRRRYFVAANFFANDVGWVLANSRWVITRSGANTISELIWWQRPAVLVPLPISGADEQKKNAAFLAKLGLGVVVLQKQLDATSWPSLLTKLEKLQPKKSLIAREQQLLATSRQKFANLVEKWAR